MKSIVLQCLPESNSTNACMELLMMNPSLVNVPLWKQHGISHGYTPFLVSISSQKETNFLDSLMGNLICFRGPVGTITFNSSISCLKLASTSPTFYMKH